MKSLVKQRDRIARVRHLQHNLAAGAAAAAGAKVQSLELNAARLSQMRVELGQAPGETSGAALARAGELALRIDQARHGLVRTIDGAKAIAARREAERLAARRDQESAEKLKEAAQSAAARLADRKAPRGRRPQSRFNQEDGDQ